MQKEPLNINIAATDMYFVAIPKTNASIGTEALATELQRAAMREMCVLATLDKKLTVNIVEFAATIYPIVVPAKIRIARRK